MFKLPEGRAVNRITLLSSLLLAALALADESQVALKDASNKQLVEANCSMCHSLDYIPMNSVFLDRNGWDGSVTKMIKVMGAPISEQDAAAIVDYLARNYGK
jgi:cytochrome c5